jgi:hypothetical protein
MSRKLGYYVLHHMGQSFLNSPVVAKIADRTVSAGYVGLSPIRGAKYDSLSYKTNVQWCSNGNM